jgi:hypothetical protein
VSAVFVAFSYIVSSFGVSANRYSRYVSLILTHESNLTNGITAFRTESISRCEKRLVIVWMSAVVRDGGDCVKREATIELTESNVIDGVIEA